MCAFLFGALLAFAVFGLTMAGTGNEWIAGGATVLVGALYAAIVPFGGRSPGQGGGAGPVDGGGNGGNGGNGGGGGRGPDRAPNPVCGPWCRETWTGYVPEHLDLPQAAPVIRQEPMQVPERWSAPVREPVREPVQPARAPEVPEAPPAPEQPIAVPNWPVRRGVETER